MRVAADRAAARIRATAQQEAAQSAEDRVTKEMEDMEAALMDQTAAAASTEGAAFC
jgi:hypothetical protein